jgi:hypothetical protein
MVVGIKNSHQVSEPAIITECDAMRGYDRGTRVDEDTLTEHERAVATSANFYWYRLTAQ